MCVDIDGQDNLQIEDFDDLRNELSRIVNVAYCSLSASGKGVFCLIPIRYPDKHKLHFEALKISFSKLGITIDNVCADVSRLRGYSYDPDAYFNLNAVTFTQLHEHNIPRTTSIFKTKSRSNFSNESNSLIKVMKVVADIERSFTDITETREQWFQIGCALANEFGQEGREIFHSVSQYYEKYSKSKTDQMFNSCLGNRYSYNLGTFFYWAEQYNLL
jgi:hypothetical protein